MVIAAAFVLGVLCGWALRSADIDLEHRLRMVRAMFRYLVFHMTGAAFEAYYAGVEWRAIARTRRGRS